LIVRLSHFLHDDFFGQGQFHVEKRNHRHLEFFCFFQRENLKIPKFRWWGDNLICSFSFFKWLIEALIFGRWLVFHLTVAMILWRVPCFVFSGCRPDINTREGREGRGQRGSLSFFFFKGGSLPVSAPPSQFSIYTERKKKKRQTEKIKIK
jgi:hypothetical protein